jgi:hypothetical protein
MRVERKNVRKNIGLGFEELSPVVKVRTRSLLAAVMISSTSAAKQLMAPMTSMVAAASIQS